MNTTARLLLLSVLMAGIAMGAYLMSEEDIVTATRPPNRDLNTLPMQLGPWRGEEIPRDPHLFPDTGAAQTVTRVYRDAQGNPLSVYAAVWMKYDIMPAHTPGTCYQGAGYQIVGEENVPLQLADGSSPSVRLMLLEKSGQQLAVLYWYHSGDRQVGNYWIRRTSWSFREEQAGPPLVKVMLQAPVSDPAKARAQLESIAAPLFEWTREL
jgi:EpsI family protein